jgi:hypothetical protein
MRSLLGAATPGLAVGEDNVDWVKVFQAATIGAVKTYFVKQNRDLTVKSVAFRKGSPSRKTGGNPGARRCAHDRHRGA